MLPPQRHVRYAVIGASVAIAATFAACGGGDDDAGGPPTILLGPPDSGAETTAADDDATDDIGRASFTHTIAAGDFLSSIANTYDVQIDDIVAVNGWDDGRDHLLLPGQEIYLPAGAREGASAGAATLPDGYKRVAEHTGMIAIAVPNSWQVENATPGVNPDRVVFPSMVVSSTGGFPAVGVFARPYEAIDDVAGPMSCTETEEPFAIGEFSGRRAWYSDCEGNDAIYQYVVVSPANHEFTVTVSYSYTDPEEEAVFDVILGTLEQIGPYPPLSDTGPTGCFRRCHGEDEGEEFVEETAPPATDLVVDSAPPTTVESTTAPESALTTLAPHSVPPAVAPDTASPGA